MKEIGGYFELEEYTGSEYHANAFAFNCGRNALAYLIQARGYKKVYIPRFCCDSVIVGVRKSGANFEWYDVDSRLRPVFDKTLKPKEAVFIINYYGQLSNEELHSYYRRWSAVIVDNTQAFFQKPASDMDTVYSCRKFFGVADGAYLASTVQSSGDFEIDTSAQYMGFVLGRYEGNASDYYAQAAENNKRFDDEPIRFMSKLTHNLLRGIDYKAVKRRRFENAVYIHERIGDKNQLDIHVPDGAFMYPFYGKGISGRALRQYLQTIKIYVPCLWPDVIERESKDSLASQLADEIVPLPCDQRYGQDTMKTLVGIIEDYLRR